MDAQDFEDWLENTIADSLEPDWTPRTAAQHILANLEPPNPEWQLRRVEFTWNTNA